MEPIAESEKHPVWSNPCYEHGRLEERIHHLEMWRKEHETSPSGAHVTIRDSIDNMHKRLDGLDKMMRDGFETTRSHQVTILGAIVASGALLIINLLVEYFFRH